MINAIRHAGILSGLMVAVFLRAPLSGLSEEPQVSPSSASQASSVLSPPDRGFISSEPGLTWEQGLFSGNSTIGASVLGRPLDEIVVLSHKRLFVPERPPLLPPPSATRLFEIRRLIDRGLYASAGQLAEDVGEQKGFLYPDPLMPAFDLRVVMTAEGEVRDYLRATDFETGETIVHWADDRGAFERGLFVSRADGIAVMRISGPGPGRVSCRLMLAPREPNNGRFRSNTDRLATTTDASALTYRNEFTHAYPGSIQALEGVARVVATNGTTSTDGPALTVAGAAWAAHFFYDYWLYTGDRAFLAGHSLPFMEKAALFFEDYLTEGPDGRYVFSPTQSPENAPANTRSQVTFNATMDVAAAKELLANTIAVSRELGVNRDKVLVWERMLAKMPPYLLNRYWLHNPASMHNAKKLFNMDISGGLPAVVIKMLAASEPGVVRLLPALPAAWPSGTIEGVLCPGQRAEKGPAGERSPS